MAVRNAFSSNDWSVRPLSVLILSLLFAFWGSIALETLGFTLPLLRQIAGFLFLTFVPGLLLLRILQFRNLGTIETTVYAVGLSLATLMFTGFFVNMVYPLFGVARPLSLCPLVATISALVVILCFLDWIRYWDFAAPVSVNLHKITRFLPGSRDQNPVVSTSINLREILSLPVLALSLLPFGAIAGTYLMNFYGTNTLQMILLPVIALVPVVIVCTQFIPEKYYSYAVFSVAITLLYHTALISTFIWGWDVQYEYYLINTAVQNGFWDLTICSNFNAMLSLMTLAPTYSILLGIGLDWVFKIIYPFFFALVPFGLYAVFRRQTNGKSAFLACFFFMSIFVFYIEMIALARQEIAELFVVLILLSMIDQGASRLQKSILFLIFSVSLVVSHYGLSYIFLLMLLSALAIAIVGCYVDLQDWIGRFSNWMNERIGHFEGLKLQKVSLKPPIILIQFVIWYIIFLVAWYIYMASSASFSSSVTIGKQVWERISSDLLNPDAAQGMAVIINEAATPLHEVGKYLHLLTIFLIVVGFVVTVITRQRGINFDIQYLLLSCGALGVCIGGVALPCFASALNTSRLYQMSLILLAPFCVIGGMALISGLRSSIFEQPSRSLQVLSLFCSIFLLFNCGWIYEVCQDERTSFALSADVDSPRFSGIEIKGGEWLSNFKGNSAIYADTYRWLLLLKFSGRDAQDISKIYPLLKEDSYVFLGERNILMNSIQIVSGNNRYTVRGDEYYTLVTSNHNRIYSNNDAMVYYIK